MRYMRGGFKHNEQSVRIVEKLEKDGAGLNLTWEVRGWHTKPSDESYAAHT